MGRRGDLRRGADELSATWWINFSPTVSGVTAMTSVSGQRTHTNAHRKGPTGRPLPNGRPRRSFTRRDL